MTARAVGYVRARVAPSNPPGEQDMIATQTRAIASECERRGWILDELFVDRGSSASHSTRAGLRAALNLLAAGGHVAMVVYGLDRVASRDEEWLDIELSRVTGTWELVVAS